MASNERPTAHRKHQRERHRHICIAQMFSNKSSHFLHPPYRLLIQLLETAIQAPSFPALRLPRDRLAHVLTLVFDEKSSKPRTVKRSALRFIQRANGF